MFPTSKLSPFFWFTQQLHLLVKTAYRRERGRSQAMAISPAHRPDRLARLPFRVSFSASPVERCLLVYRAQAHISARFDHALRRENTYIFENLDFLSGEPENPMFLTSNFSLQMKGAGVCGGHHRR